MPRIKETKSSREKDRISHPFSNISYLFSRFPSLFHFNLEKKSFSGMFSVSQYPQGPSQNSKREGSPVIFTSYSFQTSSHHKSNDVFSLVTLSTAERVSPLVGIQIKSSSHSACKNFSYLIEDPFFLELLKEIEDYNDKENKSKKMTI